ncbi:cysteine-rich DPF motif domain-containing protein 1 [Notechis scutatus]|uniref:Cysteine-rich DPF motif domain-containing protein 1 n=1 Tax=Notechis scutatus TaxID=8663 RepID=A0A6J1UX84_9SAUR|nr:cysteine-rich DPF motif domain-containing protein 1 [Notechis scutatus]
MESKKDTFECELCGLTAPYSYYGHKPPNAYSVTLLEDCYVMKDPFSPDKDRFLILGAQCSVCHKRVCVGPHPQGRGVKVQLLASWHGFMTIRGDIQQVLTSSGEPIAEILSGLEDRQIPPLTGPTPIRQRLNSHLQL